MKAILFQPPAQRVDQGPTSTGPPVSHRPGPGNGRAIRGGTVRGVGRPSMDRQGGGRLPFSDDSGKK